MMNFQKIILSIFIALLLSACFNSNSVMFGKYRLNLDHMGTDARLTYLHYINTKQGINVAVTRQALPNANSHLKNWTKDMLPYLEKHRDNPLVEKHLNGITYYEAIDKATNATVVYSFGINQKNNAVLMKASVAPAGTKFNDLFIKYLDEFKAY